MKTEKVTSLALRYSVFASMAIIIGGIISSLCFGNETLLKVGVMFLIITPLISVAVSAISLALNKEWKWVLAATILIAVTAIGMAAEHFL